MPTKDHSLQSQPHQYASAARLAHTTLQTALPDQRLQSNMLRSAWAPGYRSLLILLMAMASGCASYKMPVALPDSQISAAKLAAATQVISTLELSAQLNEKVAMASAKVCTKQGPRLPFALFINPEINDPELRAAFMRSGKWTGQPKLVALTDSATAYEGKCVVRVDDESIKPGEAGKAFWTALGKSATQKAVKLTFADGTTASLSSSVGCRGILGVEPYMTREPINFGIGIEVLPMDWALTANNPDELMFLLGRTLYFTSDEGSDKLTNGLFAGAAINGLLKLATFGVSAMFIDAKKTVPTAVRAYYLKEADAFGMQAAVRAGADPAKVMAYVQRMAADNNAYWPELRFGEGRVAALSDVVAGLTDSTPRPLTAQ